MVVAQTAHHHQPLNFMRGAIMKTIHPFLMLTILLGSALASGQESAPPTTPEVAHVQAASSTIIVDGALDERAWLDATVILLDNEWFPGDNIAPPVKTEALVTFDQEALYVAFRAHDPEPQQIRAHLGC